MDLIKSLDSLNIESEKSNNKIVISIGCDCSVAYNIRKLNFAKEAFPFDWMKLEKVTSIINMIQNDFEGFCNIDQYEIFPQYANFMYNENEEESVDLVNLTEIPEKLSKFKMVHKKYRFTLPHEYDGEHLDIEKFKAKYTRRIERFRKYVKDSKFEITFIRLGSFKDKKHMGTLSDVLDDYCKHDNFSIYYLNESLYELPKTENFIWTREHIPWLKILSL